MYVITANDQGLLGDARIGRVIYQGNVLSDAEDVWSNAKNGGIRNDENWNFEKEEYISLFEIQGDDFKCIKISCLINEKWHQDLVNAEIKRILGRKRK